MSDELYRIKIKKLNELKKALKIIKRLEQISSEEKLNIKIVNKGGKIILETKDNQFLIQIAKLIFFIGPLVFIYFQRYEMSLVVLVVMIICSIISLISYYKGSYQTDNRIEINLTTGEIRLNRKSFFGKLTRKERIIKTKKSNKVIKEDIPFSDSLDIRLTLKSDTEQIPLIDLKDDSILDQVFLSLNLLVKYEMEEKDN